ncbi:MAG: aminomethyl-transferring glycine dehydrogenase [Planctomycetota bacterium]|nr:aminomethyl-transferring glycine dehydrogenase [Planctomycetota bacterium]
MSSTRLQSSTDPIAPNDTFARRHIGPTPFDIEQMLAVVGYPSLDAITEAAMPSFIRVKSALTIQDPTNTQLFATRGEYETLASLRVLASQNEVWRTYIGMGYSGTLTPPVIARNILENPGWYTAYTPYQAEIAQGRLEALLNFQTLVTELTGLPTAGASLLDEATAAAEALAMCLSIAGGAKRSFFVSADCHPQTVAVLMTRADALGATLEIGDPETADFTTGEYCGALLAYPSTDGTVRDWSATAARIHAAGAQVAAVCDLLSLCLLTPPATWGADIAIGSAQRFGVPLGLGGPHAAFLSTRAEHVRRMPGRLIGVSRDAQGQTALRMAIQTREQHIKRDRATSNICTSQVLLAVMAGMYGVYHGPDGLTAIATRIHRATTMLAAAVSALGHTVTNSTWFDTIRVRPAVGCGAAILTAAASKRINFREFADGSIGIALDETVLANDLTDIVECFAAGSKKAAPSIHSFASAKSPITRTLARVGTFLPQSAFNTHRSESELLRYIKRLESKDLSLCHSMIPLGSCTMKLNATSEMLPVSWAEFSNIHPFAPAAQWKGSATLFAQLESWLCEVTGFAGASLQPNAGSQGEYAGLLVIRAYHAHRGESKRTICLIPESAHGTNPASAIVAGMQVVAIACKADGEIDLDSLRAKAHEHRDTLAAVMITYPSTHGVFETSIKEACDIVHAAGGQVYMDGANMNAQVGLARPGDIGADVCHLNLHKTFCIPHGGGGPGVGPICVASHLCDFLPGHPVVRPASAGRFAIGPVSAAPYGSASILPISWMYIAMMGSNGIRLATQVAILNANYMAARLAGHYPIKYVNANGRCAHEFIMDCNGFEKSAGIKVDDIAKRLMDYGFHAPTMSWPEAGMLMVEPTESEGRAELDRLCDAFLLIREEIRAIEEGRMPRDNNTLRNAPHTASVVTADHWNRPYTREQAAYPAGWLRGTKFWPAVSRIDNPFGDRNLVCTCDGMSAYT